jgi:hypothetical protein
MERGDREHRERARALPEWCTRLLRALESIDISTLPPAASWPLSIDDVGQLSVRLQCTDELLDFEIPDWPDLWLELPNSTRAALEDVTTILERRARQLHESGA